MARKRKNSFTLRARTKRQKDGDDMTVEEGWFCRKRECTKKKNTQTKTIGAHSAEKMKTIELSLLFSFRL
jgi:hypothetical protein